MNAWIQRCPHERNVWLPASHLRAGCGKYGQDSENGVAARRADGRLSRARARARPSGLLLTTPARARACRSIFHRIWTPQCQNAVKMRSRPVPIGSTCIPRICDKGNSSQEFLLYLHKIVKISFSMQYARILHRHSYHLPLRSYVRFSHKKAHPHPLFCTFP